LFPYVLFVPFVDKLFLVRLFVVDSPGVGET
ncbi:MAG: hypothetical protein RL328_625, partial [Acidobacteriota bacterium]